MNRFPSSLEDISTTSKLPENAPFASQKFEIKLEKLWIGSQATPELPQEILMDKVRCSCLVLAHRIG